MPSPHDPDDGLGPYLYSETYSGVGGGAAAPLTLAASGAAVVPLTLAAATSQSGDLFRVQSSALSDLLRVNSVGRQLIGDSVMLGVGAGAVDAMLVVHQQNPAVQTQIWRGSPRGDGFQYTARISDGAHFTTNGAITSNGSSALLPQPVREAQSPPSQYMFAAHVDLSPAVNNAAFVSDTVNGIAHFNGFVQGGGLYPYFRIAYDGELQWSDGATSTPSTFTSIARGTDGALIFKLFGTEKFRIKPGGEVGIGTAFPVSALTIDHATLPLRIRSSPNRYRADFIVDSGGFKFLSYDDTGAVFMPINLQGSEVRLYTGFSERLRLDSSGNLCFWNTGQVGGGIGVIGITNANTVPSTNASGGGVLYAEGGALKWRGSSGTTTVVAPA